MDPHLQAHDRLVEDEKKGDITIGVDRIEARRFYTEISLSDIETHTGARPYVQKGLVLASWIAGPILLLAAFITLALALSWWSLLGIPLAALVYTIYYVGSPRGTSKLWPMTAIVVLAGIATFARLLPNQYLSISVLLLAVSLWSTRFTYIFSTGMLRAFVLTNARAYQWLAPILVVVSKRKDAAV